MDTNGFTSKAWPALRAFLQARQRGVDNLDALSDVNVRSLSPEATSKLKALLDAALIDVPDDAPRSRRDSERTSLRNLCMKLRLQQADTGTGFVVISDGTNSPSSLAIAGSTKRYSKVVPTDLHRLLSLGALLEVLRGSFKEPEDGDDAKRKKEKQPPVKAAQSEPTAEVQPVVHAPLKQLDKRVPPALSDQVVMCLQHAGLFAGGKCNGAIAPSLVQRLLSELRRDTRSSISIPALIREVVAARSGAQSLSSDSSLAAPGFGLYPGSWVIPPSATEHMEAATLFQQFHGGTRMSIIVPKSVVVHLLKSHVFLNHWELVVRNVIFRTDASVCVVYRCFRRGILRRKGGAVTSEVSMTIHEKTQVVVWVDVCMSHPMSHPHETACVSSAYASVCANPPNAGIQARVRPSSG